jgi:hypothetical protein
MFANGLLFVLMNWDTRRGHVGMGVALGSILLGLVGRFLERRVRAAEPGVAADRAAPGR